MRRVERKKERKKKTKTPPASTETPSELRSTAVLPYVKGLFEQLCPKNAVDPAKRDGVFYRIPCACRKTYIGETGKYMQERIEEHEKDIHPANKQFTAVSEHAYSTGHHPLWNDVNFIDRYPHFYPRRVKETVQIYQTYHNPNNIVND